MMSYVTNVINLKWRISLSRIALKMEGLFRLAGGKDRVATLKSAIDQGTHSSLALPPCFFSQCTSPHFDHQLFLLLEADLHASLFTISILFNFNDFHHFFSLPALYTLIQVKFFSSPESSSHRKAS